MKGSYWGQTKDGQFSVSIEAQSISTIDGLCAEAGNKETGGILIGRYADDLSTAIIQEVTAPPPDSKDGSTWFIRGISGLGQLLRSRWNTKGRTYYVGEWHYHPAFRIEPSHDDFAQMAVIAGDTRYQCKEPILVIAGKRRDGAGSRPIRAFICPAGRPAQELFPLSGPD